MNREELYKRYSVDLGGRTIAVFDTLEEAEAFVDSSWWITIATIYDHEQQRDIITEIRL